MASGDKQVKIKGEPHRWKKGESGNPAGRTTKESCLLSCIKEELGKPSINPALTNEQLIASMLVAQATKGNLKACDMVMEYTIVKPKQDMNITSNGELTVRWDGNRNETVPGNTPAASSSTPG